MNEKLVDTELHIEKLVDTELHGPSTNWDQQNPIIALHQMLQLSKELNRENERADEVQQDMLERRLDYLTKYIDERKTKTLK